MLADRTIVVTGAARGLGRAVARGAAAAGAARIIIVDILTDQGEQVASELREEGHDARFFHGDLADPTSIADLGVELANAYGAVDGLVNAAAIATAIGGKTFEEIDIETWDRVMSVNVRGTWLVTRAIAPLLRKSAQGGRIVNVASDTALWGAPVLLHYVASKGAVIAMTRSLARELGPDGITVNAVAPGLIHVEATEYVPQARKDFYIQGAAISRAGEADDVVGPILNFLTEGMRFVTGQLLPINGGLVCR